MQRKIHPQSSPSRGRDEVSRIQTRSQASEEELNSDESLEIAPHLPPIKKTKAGKRGGRIRTDYKKNKR